MYFTVFEQWAANGHAVNSDLKSWLTKSLNDPPPEGSSTKRDSVWVCGLAKDLSQLSECVYI